ncbi:MAG: dephospho-CoA kinase [Bacteroidales bacterium]|nr:dephospho-CoA kinase [Bacteroidales bacterium]
MLRIGLTGNIGSGKSLICQVFEKLGVPIFYADFKAKKILDSPILRPKLLAAFGTDIEDKNKNIINRKKLAAIVFTNKEALKKLNSLIHPQLRIEFKNWCLQHKEEKYVIQEAAILFENGFTDLFDKTIVVAAPQNIRLQRVMERDGTNKSDVLARMENQWSDSKKEAAADFIIYNDGQELVLPQVLKLHQLFSSSHLDLK